MREMKNLKIYSKEKLKKKKRLFKTLTSKKSMQLKQKALLMKEMNMNGKNNGRIIVVLDL